MELLEKHRANVRACSLCFPSGGNTPVVEVSKESRILLVGQAPGSTGVTTRLPFSGLAGKRLVTWFERAALSRKEAYLSAVSRGFPGKAKGGGDLVPSRVMSRNCRLHLLREFTLLRPKVVVPVGGLAVKELLGVARLSGAVGRKFGHDGIV